MIYKWYDMHDLYEYCRESALPLLSTYSSSFWGEYILHYEKYDRMFEHMYKTYRYFNQDPLNNDNIDSVVMDFIEDVSDYLLLNEKKYTELFKIQLLNYGNIQYDFYTEQTANTLRNITGKYNYGSRRDITSDVLGSRKDDIVNEYGPTSSIQNDDVEDKKMAFNSIDYENNSRSLGSSLTSTSSHTDKTTNNIGSQSSSTTMTKGEQEDGENRSEHENEISYIKGYKDNPVKNLERFRRYWNGYSFYGDIFKDIANEVLLV